MVKLVIFDLDGVIVDTAQFHCRAWRELLQERWGIYHTDQVDEMTKGVPRYDCMKLIAREYGIQEEVEELRRVADEKNRRYQLLLRENLKREDVFPGIWESMAYLQQQQIPVALASSSFNAPFIVQTLGLHFDYCVNPGSVAKGKPAPHIYLAAASHFGIDPRDCIGVEDALSGVTSVKSAGMCCIGVGNTEILSPADRVIPDTTGLLQALKAPCPPRPLPWEDCFGITLCDSMGQGLGEMTPRYLSQMAAMFQDQEAVSAQLAQEDVLLYSFHALDTPNHPGDVAFGITQIQPGRIGEEYYMTKGHFHQVLDTGEVYYTLSGTGYLVMELQDGTCKTLPLRPGSAVYVSKGYAHRTVNTGTVPLVCFFSFPGNAGHDYKTIETQGFRHLVLADQENQPQIVPNPHYEEGGTLSC